MMAIETSSRPSAPLPPMACPEAYKREEAEIQAAQTMVNINPHASSSAPYSSSAPSYSYSVATAASVPTSATTIQTSADSHPSSQSEYDTHPTSAPPRQSLPSIHEALGQRATDNPSRPRPRSPAPSRQYSRRFSSPSQQNPNRPYIQDSKYESYGPHRAYQPSDGASTHAPSSPKLYGPAAAGPRPSSPHERFTVPGSRPPLHFPLPPKSPPQGTPHYAVPSQSPSFAASPYVYSERQLQKNYGAAPSSELVTSFPAVATTTYGGAREHPWRMEDGHHLPSSKFDGREPQFPITVKRNLDFYDLDSLLNEVYDCSHNLMQFSEVYRTRNHSSQRLGPIAGSTPSISDVHHAIKFNAKIGEALDLTLQKLRADEAERNERIERETREAAERRQIADRVEDASRVRKEPPDGGFNPPDSKKRRGRAAPPGRCHACNRAETPEWRRGPDGARTLCNACGLHYAKHTRKLGAQKTATATNGSNLRPKSAGQN